MWKKRDGLNENANAFSASMALIEKKYRKKLLRQQPFDL